MGQAKQCDLCGLLYAKDCNGRYDILDSTKPVYDRVLDLCEDCNKSLVTWMKERREDA